VGGEVLEEDQQRLDRAALFADGVGLHVVD
jgi:hypothetical protein